MNTINFLKRAPLLGWRYVLTFVGIFLGFSNATTAQYGVVESQFYIKGNLLALDCKDSLPGIKLTLKNSDGIHEPYVANQGITATNGQFVFEISRYFNNNSYYLLYAEDPNRTAKGGFKDTVFVIQTSALQFAQSGGGHWQIDYINKEAVVFEMQRNGSAPCGDPPVIPDTLEPSMLAVKEEPVIVDAEAAIIDEISLLDPIDSASSTVSWLEMPDYYTIRAYPNPNNGPFNLEVSVAESGTAVLIIYDERLRKVFEKTMVLVEGINNEALDMSAFAAGSYYLCLSNQTIRKVVKILRSGNR